MARDGLRRAEELVDSMGGAAGSGGAAGGGGRRPLGGAAEDSGSRYEEDKDTITFDARDLKSVAEAYLEAEDKRLDDLIRPSVSKTEEMKKFMCELLLESKVTKPIICNDCEILYSLYEVLVTTKKASDEYKHKINDALDKAVRLGVGYFTQGDGEEDVFVFNPGYNSYEYWELKMDGHPNFKRVESKINLIVEELKEARAARIYDMDKIELNLRPYISREKIDCLLEDLSKTTRRLKPMISDAVESLGKECEFAQSILEYKKRDNIRIGLLIAISCMPLISGVLCVFNPQMPNYGYYSCNSAALLIVAVVFSAYKDSTAMQRGWDEKHNKVALVNSKIFQLENLLRRQRGFVIENDGLEID